MTGVNVFQIKISWKYEFSNDAMCRIFPPELATVIYIRLWLSSLECIMQKMFSTKLLDKLDRSNSNVKNFFPEDFERLFAVLKRVISFTLNFEAGKLSFSRNTAWNNPNTVPYVGLIQSVHKVVYGIYKEVSWCIRYCLRISIRQATPRK